MFAERKCEPKQLQTDSKRPLSGPRVHAIGVQRIAFLNGYELAQLVTSNLETATVVMPKASRWQL